MSETQETISLIRQAQSGDQQALNQLFETYRGLADSIAVQYFASGQEPDDVKQIAYYGLCRAIQAYDTEKGQQLSTFAFAYINGCEQNELEKHHFVYVPKRRHLLWKRLLEEQTRIRTEEGRIVAVEECARRLGISVTEATDLKNAYAGWISYNATTLRFDSERNDEAYIADTLPDTQDAIDMENLDLRLSLQPVLRTLPERLREIIRLRYEENWSVVEVGQHFGLTHQRICQLERKALTLLRQRVDASLQGN